MIARIATLLLALVLIATVPLGAALAASGCSAPVVAMSPDHGENGTSTPCGDCKSDSACPDFCAPLCHAVAPAPVIFPELASWVDPSPVTIVVETSLPPSGPEPPPPRTILLA